MKFQFFRSVFKSFFHAIGIRFRLIGQRNSDKRKKLAVISRLEDARLLSNWRHKIKVESADLYFSSQITKEQLSLNKNWPQHTYVRHLDSTLAPSLIYYALARRLAEVTLSRIKSSVGDLFGGIVPVVNLNNAYLAYLVYQFALYDLPHFIGVASNVRRNYGSYIYLDARFDPNDLEKLLPFSSRLRFRFRSALRYFQPDTALAQGFGVKYLQRYLASQPRDINKLYVELPENCPLIILGPPSDVDLIRYSLGEELIGQPVAIILKEKRKDSVDAFRKQFPDSNLIVVINMDELTDWDVMREYANFLSEMIHGDDNKSKQLPEHKLLAAHLPELLEFVGFASGLNKIVSVLRPLFIAGCLEKSKFGLILCAINGHPEIINLQHGLIPRAHMLDLTSFDEFYVWDDCSALTVINDGFSQESVLKIIGNPRWEVLSQSIDRSQRVPVNRELLSWKGGASVVTILGQPAKGMLLTEDVLHEFYTFIAKYALSRPTVKVLFRPHPSSNYKCLPTEFLELEASGDLKMLPEKVMSFGQLLAHTDVAVSIYSTALIDAENLGVPAVALDFRRLIRSLGIQGFPVSHIINSKRSGKRALDRELGIG